MSRLVSALFRSHAHARAAVDRLMREGFPRGDMSILLADAGAPPQRAEAEGQRTSAGVGAAVGAALGGGLGGVMAGLAAAGSLLVPSAWLISMGPLPAAMAGAGVGGAIGGVVGALACVGRQPQRTGVGEDDDVREGSVLLGVHVDSTETERAGALLTEAGGKRVQAELSLSASFAGRSPWPWTPRGGRRRQPCRRSRARASGAGGSWGRR
jgi:hypothetical protein